MRNATAAYGAVFIGVCGHSSSEFFAVLSGVAGPEVSVWRYVLGGAGLLAVALCLRSSRDLWSPLRDRFWAILALSFFGVSLPYLFFHWALDFATIVQVGTLVTTMPIFVGLTSLAVYKMPFTVPKILSGVCAIIGISLLLTDGYLARLAGSQDSLFGIGLALLCAVGGSAYAVLVRPLINEYGAIRMTAITMSIGGLCLWILVGTAWNVWVNPFSIFQRPPVETWSLLTIAFWNTTLTQLFWLWGLANVPDITRGSYLFFLKPVITALLALLILAQPITWVQVLAIIVVCSSVFAELIWPRFAARLASAR